MFNVERTEEGTRFRLSGIEYPRVLYKVVAKNCLPEGRGQWLPCTHHRADSWLRRIQVVA